MDERETEAAAVAVEVGDGASLLVGAVVGESLSVAANDGVSEPVAEIVAVDVGVPASADAVCDRDALLDGEVLGVSLSVGQMARMVLYVLSATYTMPVLSTATPWTEPIVAAVPMPSV